MGSHAARKGQKRGPVYCVTVYDRFGRPVEARAFIVPRGGTVSFGGVSR